MTRELLLLLKQQRRAAADRIEIATVKADPDIPAALRIEQYTDQLRNPYAYKCGDIAVNISFSETERTLEEALSDYLQAIRKHPETAPVQVSAKQTDNSPKLAGGSSNGTPQKG